MIDVRQSQIDRISAISENLQSKPFDFMGPNSAKVGTCAARTRCVLALCAGVRQACSRALHLQDMRAVTPHEAASIFTDIFGRAALKVVPLLPVLEQHPSLIVGPVPGVEWAALREGRVPLPEGVELGNPAGWASLGRLPAPPDAVQVRATPAGRVGARRGCPRKHLSGGARSVPTPGPQRAAPLPVCTLQTGVAGLIWCCRCSALPRWPQDVYQLVMHVHNMQRLYLHLFFMCPQLAMLSGVHMQAVS